MIYGYKSRTGTELIDTVESVVDPEAVEVVVAYLPYQELETSDGFPCTIDPVDPVDYARAHDRDSVYGVRFLSRSIPGYIPIGLPYLSPVELTAYQPMTSRPIPRSCSIL